jgi:hypothetical protein
MGTTDNLPLTCSVPVFGRVVYGIGRNAAYEAARRGDFPVIEVGGLKRVPVRIALRTVVGEGSDIAPLLARFRDAENEKRALIRGEVQPAAA